MAISTFSQERLQSAHIMVVGCGALGNEVLKNLALSGVGHIVVVDFDEVEPDNLSHSVLFSMADAKSRRRKVDVVEERLQTINPNIKVTPIYGDITYDVGLGLLQEMDVVIGCVDNRLARYSINRLAMRAGKPWVDGGIDGLEGTARVFAPGQNCYACNLGPEGLRDLAYRMPCSGTIRRNFEAGKVPTTSMTASVIAAVQVQEALKLLHPEALAEHRLTSLVGRMFCYEGEHLTTRTVAFKAYDADCAVHEQWAPCTITPMTNAWPIGEVLTWITNHTGTDGVSIQMANDCFVDFVEQRADNTQVRVMLPGRAVANFVENDARLTGIPFSELYQHEYREIDKAFPYQELTLEEVGIPDRDVLYVTADGRNHYYELSEA